MYFVPGTSSIGSTRVSSRGRSSTRRTLLPRFAADAEEPADLDRDVPRALALGRGEVVRPPPLRDVAVVALADARAQAQVAALLLELALGAPGEVRASPQRRRGARGGARGRGERPESARGGWSANDIGVVGRAEVNEADAATQRNDEGRGLTDLSEC